MLGNEFRIYEVDNTPLFKLIRDCKLSDSSIFINDMGSSCRNELELLKNTVNSGDTIMVRSLLDIADTLDDIVNLLKQFGDKGIEIVSTSEPYYEYDRHFGIVSDVVRICAELAEKKCRLGIARATEAGRMGRKKNEEIADRVTRLRLAGFSVDETTQICGISHSTYYRYIKK